MDGWCANDGVNTTVETVAVPVTASFAAKDNNLAVVQLVSVLTCVKVCRSGFG